MPSREFREAVVALILLATPAARASAQPDLEASFSELDQTVHSWQSSHIGTLKTAAPKPAVVAANAPQTANFRLEAGTITTEESWTTNPETGEDVLRGRVTFTPSATTPSCRSIRFVQAARVQTSKDHDLDWDGGQQNRNLMRTKADPARGITPGYFVDHDAYKCSPGKACSPYFRDSWANPDESQDGSSAKPASLIDYPFGWTSFESIDLESCARCADTGAFLGCAQWGGSWPATGERTLRPTSAADTPSATFNEALRLFEASY
jgi:hypothetical protein